ncbi:MAG: sigma-70 family RNA polymerase sigma factor [Marinoscillum sp.]
MDTNLHIDEDFSEDKDHWTRLLKKEKAALAYFFRKYYSLLFNYGLKICRDERLVEDTIQDVFVKIWNTRNLPEVTNPKSYVLIIFKNALLDKLKEAKKLGSGTFTFDHDTESIQEKIIEDESMRAVRTQIDIGLDLLPARQREILYLRFYNDLDYQEIADVLGINYQSVRNSIHESMKKLRKTIVLGSIILVQYLF